MREIDTMRVHVEAAAGLTGTLEAARDAFELLLATCEQGEESRDQWFAAFAFASAAAAEGRNLIAAAPSLPRSGAPIGWQIHSAVDQKKIARLARVLGAQLDAAARHADDTGDQAACRAAAAEADRIHGLLAGHR